MSIQTDKTEITLTERERLDPFWLRLREYLEARLDLYRRQNDNDLTPDKTAMLRGRIAEIKYLIAAGESQDDHP